MHNPSAPDVGTFLDNADPDRTLSQHLQQAMPAAQKLIARKQRRGYQVVARGQLYVHTVPDR